VQVEVDVHNGLPQIQIVGLPDASVRESRERVRAAVKNCGFDLPPRAVTINLAPADLRKEGNHLDLAIALAMLVAHGHLPQEALEGRLACGELGLDATVRPVRGGLAIADLAARRGDREVLVPARNAAEAAALGEPDVIPITDLMQAIEHLTGREPRAPRRQPEFVPALHDGGADLGDVRGQHAARRALEIAAAGGHNLLFLGPPGSGKTLLAQRLPGILPPLDPAEALEVTKIHSAAAEPIENGLVARRPFRSPHPGTSVAGMVGGGPFARPGEVSLSHAGVLFLDELPEFHRDALEALRQPLEDGSVSIVRARARWIYPARFSLVAAMNPCPCGHLGDPRHACRCPLPLVERYRSRVSGPLLDRIDMHVEVPAVALADLRSASGSEASAAVAQRVQEARERQRRRRFPGAANGLNALLQGRALSDHCALDSAGQALLDAAFERLGLSARALTRVMRLARTIADLGSSETVRSVHLAEAIQYRAMDRRLGNHPHHAVSA